MEMNIYKKMSIIKKELTELGLKQSGENTFSNFTYFEKGDFMPSLLLLQDKYGVDDTIKISRIKDQCLLILTNTNDSNDFKEIEIPYEEAQMLAKGGAPSKTDNIQRMGATISYLTRYLYLIAYNLTDKDMVEAYRKQVELDEKESHDKKEVEYNTNIKENPKHYMTELYEIINGSTIKSSQLDEFVNLAFGKENATLLTYDEFEEFKVLLNKKIKQLKGKNEVQG